MKDNINTVLFDLDGTLVNTYELIIQSFLATFKQFGFTHLTREDCIPFIGPPLYETFSSVAPEKADEMVKFYRQFNQAKHDELVTEFNGVYETVQALAENDFKLAIVSTKMRDTVLKGLEKTKLKQFFPVIITLDEVENAKPHPEPLVKAMDLLKADRERTLMVGDSSHDIKGAHNAGVKSVGVTWSIKGEDYIKKLQPDYVINEMPDLLSIVGVK